MIETFSRSIKAVAVLLFLSSISMAQLQLPQPQGFVNDFAGKLSPATKQSLETLLTNFRDRSNGIEAVVVTVPFENLQGYPIEDYALRLGRQWGIGPTTDKTGLLLVVAIKPPDSQGVYSGATRLEVSRHLEGDIPDGLAGYLIRQMRDDFRAGRFDQAISSGVQTTLATLAEKRGISLEGIDRSRAYRAQERPRRERRGISPFAILILVFVVFIIISSINRGGGGGGGGRGRRYGRRGGSDWMLWPIIFGGGGSGGFGGFGGSSSSGGSGWGGGGGGGGFGGFGGGGDFGGGGASDSW